MELVNLLKSKIRCLNKFLQSTKEFASGDGANNPAGLEKLHYIRESMMRGLQLYDTQITQLVQALPNHEKTPEFIATVRELAKIQDDLIQEILVSDQLIVKQIEQEKERLVKELTNTDRQKDMVNKFRSRWLSESGEKLDGIL